MLGEATSHQREPGCTTPRCMVASTLHYRVATCLAKYDLRTACTTRCGAHYSGALHVRFCALSPSTRPVHDNR